ncbi:hypothetical protein FACS1894130_12170 [Spirochaetia bacterium]|nr:hypothetical protein FACS1894130_12170 [Spirochaetia bacterium]
MRGENMGTHSVAKKILEGADQAARDARNPKETTGMTREQIERRSDNAANAFIDQFISEHDSTYVPPPPLDEK